MTPFVFKGWIVVVYKSMTKMVAKSSSTYNIAFSNPFTHKPQSYSKLNFGITPLNTMMMTLVPNTLYSRSNYLEETDIGPTNDIDTSRLWMQ